MVRVEGNTNNHLTLERIWALCRLSSIEDYSIEKIEQACPNHIMTDTQHKIFHSELHFFPLRLPLVDQHGLSRHGHGLLIQRVLILVLLVLGLRHAGEVPGTLCLLQGSYLQR